jgi:hypothetical protein
MYSGIHYGTGSVTILHDVIFSTPSCCSDSLECQGVGVHGREHSHLFLGVLKSLGHQEGHEVGAGPARPSTAPGPRVVPPRLGSLYQVTTQVLTLRKTKMATVFCAISEDTL